MKTDRIIRLMGLEVQVLELVQSREGGAAVAQAVPAEVERPERRGLPKVRG